MAFLRFLAAWLVALAMLVLRLTCRVRMHDDPRSALRAAGSPYVYAILHGHQLAAVMAAEPGTGAMVSRSKDGDLLVPSLLVRRVVPVRGSTREKGDDKGGGAALDRLVEHVRGGRPAYFAVDGPRGPRGHVSRGVSRLAFETGAAIVTATPVPRRRWVLGKAWDHFQIPKPFTHIDFYFGDVIRVDPSDDVESVRLRVQEALAKTEARRDPAEAALGCEAAARRRKKLELERKQPAVERQRID
jgi:lysophospholipid acyltransferase (LPLAT)-like uncharacterized protein